jgi:hypothetical protein
MDSNKECIRSGRPAVIDEWMRSIHNQRLEAEMAAIIADEKNSDNQYELIAEVLCRHVPTFDHSRSMKPALARNKRRRHGGGAGDCR